MSRRDSAVGARRGWWPSTARPGPGKSTLAQAVADHLGLERLDTGAMYRAVAWAALEHGIDVARRRGAWPTWPGAPAIEVGERVLVDGATPPPPSARAAVDAAVSAVAANPAVRAELVARQRRLGGGAGPRRGRRARHRHAWCCPTPT